MDIVKNIVVKILNWVTVGYIKRNHITVIAIAGSIGKTSTTNAVRTVLSQHYKVHQPKTTYNTNRSIHLEMFDMKFAANPLAWGWVVIRVLAKSLLKAKYQIMVVEIGTDYPGELQSFAFLKPHIGVLTAISPEHMERFQTIEAVAKEELTIASFCDKLIFNADTVPKKFIPPELMERITWYGKGTEYSADNYRMETMFTTDGSTEIVVKADFKALDKTVGEFSLNILGEHALSSLMAAMAVGLQCDLDRTELAAGLQAIEPVPGRMQRLRGVEDSTIIDDSYNASPVTAKAALDVLYQFNVPQHIAVLGSMNELGEFSPAAHREVGEYCDPLKVDFVITIGKDANEYLAVQAEARGCKVARFDSPYDAGKFVREHLQPGAVVLFKGSQNGVFAEEAIKAVLADPNDAGKLVRQSDYWLKEKSGQFDQPGA